MYSYSRQWRVKMPIVIVELLLKIILEIIQGQPPEVKQELWKMHLEDVKAWREFWSKLDKTNG